MLRTIRPILLLAIIAAAAVTVTDAAEHLFLKNPYVQNVTTKSAVIMWETTKPAEYKLTWTGDGKEPESQSAKTDDKIAEIRIGGLAANTVYKYSVEVGGKKAGGSFQTFPDAEIPFRFAAYADTQDTYKSGPARHRLYTGLMAKRKSPPKTPRPRRWPRRCLPT